MKHRIRVAALSCAIALGAVVSNVTAQAFPSSPIRLVAPSPPGGANDIVLRLIAQEITKDTGATIIIENKTGALGAVAAEAVKNSPANGYTVYVSSISIVQAPFLMKQLSFDPIADFEPIVRLALFNWVLVANPTLKLNSTRDLVNAAKAAPGKLNFGYGAAAALAATSMFNQAVGIDALAVGYKAQGQALLDVMAGRLSYMLVDVTGASPHIAAGKLTALAVPSEARVPILPNVPTMREAGYPGTEFVGWIGLSAPAKTPDTAVQWIAEKVTAVLKKPHVVERLNTLGITAAPQPPAAYGAFMKSELVAWQKRIVAAGIKPE